MKRQENFEEHHAEKVAEFINLLSQSRFWHLLPEGESNTDQANGLFDTQTGLLYPSTAALQAFLAKHPFA